MCYCPIKFLECVLLLEAAALNYSVDYYHDSATVVVVPAPLSQIQTLFSYETQVTVLQNEKRCIRVALTLQLYKDTSAIHKHWSMLDTIRICGSVQSSNRLFSIPREREREADRKEERRKRRRSDRKEREEKSDGMQRLLA